VSRQDGAVDQLRLGPTRKHGNGCLRRLLINGAMAVLLSRPARQDAWLGRLLASKPRKAIACALGNK